MEKRDSKNKKLTKIYYNLNFKAVDFFRGYEYNDNLIKPKYTTNHPSKYLTGTPSINKKVITVSKNIAQIHIEPYSDIAWCSGIVVSKHDSQYLQYIAIKIGTRQVVKISCTLLIKLYSYEISDDLILIKIPRKLIIAESICNDKKDFQGIPLYWLHGSPSYGASQTCTSPCTLIIYSRTCINYYIIIDYTSISRFDYPLLFTDSRLTMNLTSYGTIDRLGDNNVLLCLSCFREYAVNNLPIVSVLKTIRLNKMLEMNCISAVLYKLIIEYDDFDIIIYDTKGKNIQYYKISYTKFEIKNSLISVLKEQSTS